jgi:hypothetical protein
MERIFSCRRLLKIPVAVIAGAAGETTRLYLLDSFFLLSAKLFAICLYRPVDATPGSEPLGPGADPKMVIAML